MNYVEYGKENSNVIILLHGGGLSWWNYKEAAEMLQSDYRVILPILDGHSNCERDFLTIEDNAREIIEFVDEQFRDSVLLLGGLSLGAQIVLEILSKRRNICRYARRRVHIYYYLRGWTDFRGNSYIHFFVKIRSNIVIIRYWRNKGCQQERKITYKIRKPQSYMLCG